MAGKQFSVKLVLVAQLSVNMPLQDNPSPLMTGTAPLRQHIASSRAQGSPAGKASQLYSRVIRVAAAIQHVSVVGAAQCAQSNAILVLSLRSTAGAIAQPVVLRLFALFLLLQDLEYDRRLQDVPRLLPSSLNLPGITAAEYCANYVHQLRTVLAQSPPNQPTETAIDMLVAVAQLQR